MVKADIEEFKKVQERSLSEYIKWLLSVITLDHKYERVEDKEDSVRFRFTNCPLANFFSAIGKPQYGKFFCDADGPFMLYFMLSSHIQRSEENYMLLYVFAAAVMGGVSLGG